MTNPTLERAARAAAVACEQARPSDEHDAEAWTFIARAVLMAVREPSMDVGLIGAEEVNRNMRGSSKADYCAAKDAFAAMIDAILSESND